MNKPYPAVLLSWFRDGFDSHELSQRFGISEARVVALIAEGRRNNAKRQRDREELRLLRARANPVLAVRQ